MVTSRKFLLRIAMVAVLALRLASAGAADVDANRLGAKGDGRTMNTSALQLAIDQCSASGGGRVTLAPGRYLSGGIRLRSHVELCLPRGVELIGSTAYTRDYPDRAFIYAEGIEDAGISGNGIISGNATHHDVVAQGFVVNDSKRPNVVFFKDCRNMSATGIRIIDGGSWTFRLFRCDGVTIDRISIRCLAMGNNDGIDVDARNVIISNCNIEAEDDGICLKSDDANFMPENIVVTNCIIASNCNPIKFGTASRAGFRNVTISNCVIKRTSESNIWNWPHDYRGIKEGTLTGLAGIAIESADGGRIEHVCIQNITMEGIITPIFIVLNHRRDGNPCISDVHISHVTATAEGVLPSMIVGSPTTKVSDITLRDIFVEHQGGEQAMTEPLPEALTAYPENRMFGHRNPAGGLYVRHARNVTVENFHIRQRQTDYRPAVVLDDVEQFEARGITSTGNLSELIQNQQR